VLAAISLDFDPTAAPFGLTVRLETLALAGVILLSLVVAAVGAGRMRAATRPPTSPSSVAGSGSVSGSGSAASAGPRSSSSEGSLRRDDLILIAFGAVPGAVVGGRIGYGLIHLDYFGSNLTALADPGQGGLGLTLGVVLGTASALAVARLLAAPLDGWLHVASGPLLIGLGLGKLVMALGGDGQGRFSDASWATAYVGSGPWASNSAADPALPSQVLEGGLVLIVAAAMVAIPFLIRLRPRPWRRIVRPGLAPRRDWLLLTGYRRFVTAIGLWGIVRFGVAFTWRDASVLGPFGADQLVLAAVLGACVAVFVIGGLNDRRRTRLVAAAPEPDAEAGLPSPKGLDSAAVR
jgi:Prolipoprotein diacylglyceryl transferase